MSNSVKNFLYTAIVTPFDLSGEVSYSELEALIRLQEKAGNGIVILGSTGEGLALEEEEKRKIIHFVSTLKLNTPVLVGVSGFQLNQTIDFLHFAEKENIDGYLMPVPLYAKPGPEGQTHWFTTLMDQVKKPVMIYNVPSRTGVKLHLECLSKIAKHQNAWAVKEASGSLEEFTAYRKVAENLDFYSGDDGLTPEFTRAGAVGLVSVASNVWPKAASTFVKQCLEQSLSNESSQIWKKAADSLFLASNPVPAKTLLSLKGVIQNSFVRPPLSENDLKQANVLKEQDSIIENWHKNF
ncbi:MAG: 4-hydroxy-tetrahydrodipicolinate synthase [Oligoflexia bacterium]|nr:4-hydroxy-tetrahydrodipicolinate synthase [Oligoflexia bacterium]